MQLTKIKKPALYLNDLTTKEREILSMLCSDKTYDEMAKELFLSIKTVDRHRAEIFKKLHVKSRLSLVLFVVNNRLVV